MRYHFIQEQRDAFSLAALCRAMQVSVSGYYAWRKRPTSQRQQQNVALSAQITTVHQESKATYGSPRIYKELHEQGIACSEKRIARLMCLAGLRGTLPRRFVITTNSDAALPVAENLLAREFTVLTPGRPPAGKDNARWTTDITYIWTQQGWLYLAVILDLFSRRIVGWAMGHTLERSLVLSALDMAIADRRPCAGLLCHSDRGSQYQSSDYQARLKANGVTCSMSRKGNCWDNAPTESFFATLKRELVYRTTFASREAARTAVFEWIETWYNRKRRHSSLGYLSPEAFEKNYQQQQQQEPIAA